MRISVFPSRIPCSINPIVFSISMRYFSISFLPSAIFFSFPDHADTLRIIMTYHVFKFNDISSSIIYKIFIFFYNEQRLHEDE